MKDFFWFEMFQIDLPAIKIPRIQGAESQFTAQFEENKKKRFLEVKNTLLYI